MWRFSAETKNNLHQREFLVLSKNGMLLKQTLPSLLSSCFVQETNKFCNTPFPFGGWGVGLVQEQMSLRPETVKIKKKNKQKNNTETHDIDLVFPPEKRMTTKDLRNLTRRLFKKSSTRLFFFQVLAESEKLYHSLCIIIETS